MRHATILALAVVLAAGPARANVWQEAIRRGAPDPARERYDAELDQGDDHARQAAARGISRRQALQHLQLALASYRAAAAARPEAAEPHYRIGRLIFSLYFENCDREVLRFQPALSAPLCDPDRFDRRRAEEVIAAWDAFEQRAPLDPRLGTFYEVGFQRTDILMERAILNTKLDTPARHEAAVADYEKMLQRQDPELPMRVVQGNLAETYMMLGQLERAIDTYREAIRAGADGSTWYGLAVALDRDERGDQARDVIRAAGQAQLRAFQNALAEGRIFFVPAGEEQYYLALAHEAFGLDAAAIEHWRAYIQSGARPEYQPRARAHLDALLARQKRKQLPIGVPWRDLLR